MIKEIICPTDFSEVANNAIEYAAKFTQVLGIRLKILNIQNLFIPIEKTGWIGSGALMENAKVVSDTMNEMCIEINKMFNISCSHDVDLASGSLERAIARNTKKDSLLVMGTNGVDSIYQYFFGTNTHNVINKSQCPVLIVPENVGYGSITKIVFAWDHSRQSLATSDIEEIFTAMKPEITFLHVNTKNKPVGPVPSALKNEICSLLEAKGLHVRFEETNADSVPQEIDRYMNQSESSMLVITHSEHKIPKNIFHRSITKQIGLMARYPVLVLHR